MEKLSIFDEAAPRPVGRYGERYFDALERVIGAPTGDDITYLHVIFAQTGFPYKPVPKGQPFQRRNGQAVIGLTPGYLLDLETGELELQGLPFGVTPRKLMLHVCNETIRSGKREIDLNTSMTRFVDDDLEMSASGGVRGGITAYKEQVNCLAATQMVIGLNYVTPKGGRGASTFKPAPAISGYKVWDDDSLIGKPKFNTTLQLSESFFEGVQIHSIPLDDRAISFLGRSPLRLDVYFNLAQRLHRIPYAHPLLVTYKDLHAQMGQEYARPIDFVRKYREAVEEVKKVYPDANVVFKPEGVEFRHSKPPVPRKLVQGLLFPPPSVETAQPKPRRSRRSRPDPNVGVSRG
jgi:Plasmid encoded RepA protein